MQRAFRLMPIAIVMLLAVRGSVVYSATPSPLPTALGTAPTLAPSMSPPGQELSGPKDIPLMSGDFTKVTLLLSSERALYGIGQDVLLSATLVNHGRREVRFVTTHKLFRDVDLTVLDSSGERVEPNIDREVFSGSVGPTSLTREQPRTDSAQLRSWGYVLKPGAYKIYGTFGPVTSNRISIRVVLPLVLRSEPIPASWIPCKADPDVDYRSVFPTDLKNAVSPDIGVIVFSVPFGLVSARLTLNVRGTENGR